MTGLVLSLSLHDAVGIVAFESISDRLANYFARQKPAARGGLRLWTAVGFMRVENCLAVLAKERSRPEVRFES